jgi:hypothetical protein
MRIFTVICDGRPTAVVRAMNKADAIALALDLAEDRDLLGPAPSQRRFDVREPTDAEMVEWIRHRADRLILDTPLAA